MAFQRTGAWDELCQQLATTELQTVLENWIQETSSRTFPTHLLRNPSISIGTEAWLRTIHKQMPSKLHILGRLMQDKNAEYMLGLIRYAM